MAILSSGQIPSESKVLVGVESPCKALNCFNYLPGSTRWSYVSKFFTGFIGGYKPWEIGGHTPYLWALRQAKFYEDKHDFYNGYFYNGTSSVVGGYAGHSFVSGPGRCPQVSGYPQIIHGGTGPDAGTMEGESKIWGKPRSISAMVTTTGESSEGDSWDEQSDPQHYPFEQLHVSLENEINTPIIIGDVVNSFLDRPWPTDWREPSFRALYDDYANTERTGGNVIGPTMAGYDTTGLNPDDYSGSLIVRIGGEDYPTNFGAAWRLALLGPYETSIASSGWSIVGLGPFVAFRGQYRYVGVNQITVHFLRLQLASWDNGYPYGGAPFRYRITYVGGETLNPKPGGERVIEIPWSADAPYPLKNIHDTAIISDMTFIVAGQSPDAWLAAHGAHYGDNFA